MRIKQSWLSIWRSVFLNLLSLIVDFLTEREGLGSIYCTNHLITMKT